MKRTLLLGFAVAAVLGCQLPADQEAYRPLREHGPRPKYDDLVSRARRQADLALEASYASNWGDLQDLSRALSQTAQLLPGAPDGPEPTRAETVRTLSRDLQRDAGKLAAAAREIDRLSGEAKEKKLKEVNALLLSVNKAVRSLR